MTIVAGLTETIMYWIAMLIGSIMAVVIPYMLNKWKDKKTEVVWSYVAILLFASVVATFFMLPSKVDIIDLDAIKAAVATGYGLAAVIGKMVKTILEPKDENIDTPT
jgi:hypothetical protein